MRRRDLIIGLVAMLAAAPAAAQNAAVERITRELRGLGYSQISVERTLLGRARIVADGPDASREIIVNPNTGEILRDLWIPRNAAGTSGELLDVSSADADRDNSGSNSGSGKGDDDKDDDSRDDDSRDDDRDDDRNDDSGGDDSSGDDSGGDDDGGNDDGGKGRGSDDD